MNDATGKEIEPGMKLLDEEGVKYVVINGDFNKGEYGEGPDLIADAGYMKSLLWPERAKLFRIIEE